MADSIRSISIQIDTFASSHMTVSLLSNGWCQRRWWREKCILKRKKNRLSETMSEFFRNGRIGAELPVLKRTAVESEVVKNAYTNLWIINQSHSDETLALLRLGPDPHAHTKHKRTHLLYCTRWMLPYTFLFGCRAFVCVCVCVRSPRSVLFYCSC